VGAGAGASAGRWFAGGALSVCHNALDRHVRAGRAAKVQPARHACLPACRARVLFEACGPCGHGRMYCACMHAGASRAEELFTGPPPAAPDGHHLRQPGDGHEAAHCLRHAAGAHGPRRRRPPQPRRQGRRPRPHLHAHGDGAAFPAECATYSSSLGGGGGNRSRRLWWPCLRASV
jgi:hypothetical protein